MTRTDPHADAVWYLVRETIIMIDFLTSTGRMIIIGVRASSFAINIMALLFTVSIIIVVIILAIVVVGIIITVVVVVVIVAFNKLAAIFTQEAGIFCDSAIIAVGTFLLSCR